MDADDDSTAGVVLGDWVAVSSSKRPRDGVQSSPTNGSCQYHGVPKRSKARVVAQPRNQFCLVPLCAVAPPRTCGVPQSPAGWQGRALWTLQKSLSCQ